MRRTGKESQRVVRLKASQRSTHRLPSQRACQSLVTLHHQLLPAVEAVSYGLWIQSSSSVRMAFSTSPGGSGPQEQNERVRLTLPSFWRRLTAEKPVPVTANMTVKRPVSHGNIQEAHDQLALSLSSPYGALDAPKGIRASKGTGWRMERSATARSWRHRTERTMVGSGSVRRTKGLQGG